MRLTLDVVARKKKDRRSGNGAGTDNHTAVTGEGSERTHDPVQPPAVIGSRRSPRVLVLSFNNVGNFGDRLGFHLLSQVLPVDATVTWAHFVPWDVPDEPFDLLILGIGNSLFAPLLTPSLLGLLDRIPLSVGIFGTQYREKISAASMHAVIDRLTVWMARYADDVALYGRGRSNVLHLGDWLINAFSMAESVDGERLVVGDEIWQDFPMDVVISRIQRHQEVFSTRLHPLLCALTSAQRAAFREQRERGGAASGKFRSMLLDVFGCAFPENEFFPVNRQAVIEYKARVRAMTLHLRDLLTALLAGSSQPASGVLS